MSCLYLRAQEAQVSSLARGQSVRQARATLSREEQRNDAPVHDAEELLADVLRATHGAALDVVLGAPRVAASEDEEGQARRTGEGDDDERHRGKERRT